MKKMLMIFSISALLIIAWGCGGGKYDDAKEALNKQYDLMQDFSVGIENAKNSDDIVAVLEKFQKTAEETKAEMMALLEKYPELKDKVNPPEELKAEIKKMDEIGPKFFGAMMKIGKEYGDNPEVKQALQKMQQALKP